MRAKLPTIKDVARLASVSISTVSAVINANKPVSGELRERVEAAIRQLDFHPNHQARVLNRKRSKTLAYLTPDIGNSGFLKIFNKVSHIARDRGYSMVLVDASGTEEDVRAAIRRIVELRVDGAFLTMSWRIVKSAQDLTGLSRGGILATGIAGSWPIKGSDCYLWDEEDAGMQLGRYLSQIGHQDVLFLAPKNSRSAELRARGLLRGLRQTKPDTELIHQVTDYTSRGGYDALQLALASGKAFKTVVGFNDAISTGAIAALSDQGLTIPDRISFASFGDSLQEFARPPITSMTFNEADMATDCANRLIDRIEGLQADEPNEFFYKMQLRIQVSTRFQPESVGGSPE